MPEVTIYEWTGHTWGGWWKGDAEKGLIPVVYSDVELRQMDNRDLWHGMCMTFELDNDDDYRDGSKGCDRWYMEGVKVDFYSGDYTLEGFVMFEHFGGSRDNERDGDPAVYRKQRWVVRNA